MTSSLQLAALVFVSLTAACVGTAPDGTGDGGGDGKADSDGDDDGSGDGTGDGGGGGDGASVADYFEAIGQRDCDDAFQCRSNFPTAEGSFEELFGASASACYADAAAYYDANAVEAAISDGTIEFDGDAAAACIDGLAPATCATYWTQGPAWPAACDDVMVGTVADGGACTIDFECESYESYCDGTCKVYTGE